MTSPSRPARYPSGQTLLIDADDTLWENSIYFERAIAAFITYLGHGLHTAAEVREHLNKVEQDTITALGYGLESFRHSLMLCFEQLAEEPLTQERRQRIGHFTQSIVDQEIELLPGVAETLAHLAERHRILLVTKGSPVEQRGKLHRSGVAKYFAAVEVLPEKHEDAYRSLAAHHGCETATTWMIGNSPRSDINPAFAAGMHAVFIPHEFTWVLEHETICPPPPGQKLLELSSFAELAKYF